MKRAANCPRYEREREREGETDSGQRTLSSLNTKLTKHVQAGGKWHEAEATSSLGRGKVNTRLKDSLSLSLNAHTHWIMMMIATTTTTSRRTMMMISSYMAWWSDKYIMCGASWTEHCGSVDWLRFSYIILYYILYRHKWEKGRQSKRFCWQ